MNIYDFISSPVICIHDFKNYNRFFQIRTTCGRVGQIKAIWARAWIIFVIVIWIRNGYGESVMRIDYLKFIIGFILTNNNKR